MQLSGDAFQFLWGCRINHPACSHCQYRLFLGRVRAERNDVTSPVLQKFQGHMTQATDSNDAHFIRWFNSGQYDGVEDRNAATKQWAGFAHINILWQQNGPRPVPANHVGKAAISSYNCCLTFGAEMVCAIHALLAAHT